MSDNIEKVLSRGEKLDLLVDKTDNLMFEVRPRGGGHHLAARMPDGSHSLSSRLRWGPDTIAACATAGGGFPAWGCRTRRLRAPSSPTPAQSQTLCMHARLCSCVQADRFVKSGRALRRKMWWNNLKMKLVMGFAVIMVVLIIFLLICFGSGKSCVNKGKKGSSSSSPSPAPAAAGVSPAPAGDGASSGTGRRLLMTAAGEAAQALMASW